MAERKRTRLRICELNPHLLCALCGGYLIDATTIVECLHSFCKTCILRYLETSNYCPICEVLIHKKRPWQNIRLDHTLQNAVYKLVPALFKREMQRRRDFYEKNPPPSGKETEQVHVAPERIIFSEDEKFSVSLEFSPNGRAVQIDNEKSVETTVNKTHHDKRFLLCPANVCIGHLKKFVRLKYTLPECYQIDLFYSDEPLEDTYTLMDVAYIYSWRRENVLTLYYSFYQRPRKRRRVTASATASTQDHQTAGSGRVIKTKASTTSSSSTTTVTTTTTSTVTIVEASDAGSTTEGEGAKTTVSVSIPSSSSTSLPVTLALPLPPPEASSKTNSLGFDEDEDDDDDERPLIIVTDTPACATPMEVDMAEGESGVTIIPHSRAPSSKKGGAREAADGRSSSAADGDPCKASANTLPSAPCSAVSSSVTSAVTVSNIPTSSCSSSSGVASVSSSASSAESATAAETSNSSSSACSTRDSALTEQERSSALSTHAGRPSDKGRPHTSQCPQPVTEPMSSGRHCAESVRPAEAGQHADSSQPSQFPPSTEAVCVTHSSHAGQVNQLTQPADDAQPKESSRPIQSASAAQSSALAADTCATECSPSADAVPVKNSISAESSLPVVSTQALEPKSQTESKCLSETSTPPSETVPVDPNLSQSCTKPVPPSGSSPSKDPHRPRDIPGPQQPSQCAESSGPRGPTTGRSDSSKSPSSERGENSKKETRPVGSPRGSQLEASASTSRPKNSSSSPGLFERIYTVTSNCTASGIKSIFKTAAIIPASSASRRYSDVSGLAPVTGIGARRASTGGGGKVAKKHGDKDKPKVPLHKQKSAPPRGDRSSLDALAHLAKNSVFTSSHGSKAGSHKAADIGSETPKSSHNLPSRVVPTKTPEKRPSAKDEVGAVGDKETCSPAAYNGSSGKSSLTVPSAPSAAKEPKITIPSTNTKSATAPEKKAVDGAKPKATGGDKVPKSSGDASKPETKVTNNLTTGDLRVKLPKCPGAHDRLSAAINQIKQRHSDNANQGAARKAQSNESVVREQTSGSSSHTSGGSDQSRAQSSSAVKPVSAGDGKLGEDSKLKLKTGVGDKALSKGTAGQSKPPTSEAESPSKPALKDSVGSGPVDKRTTSASSAAQAVSAVSSSVNSVAGSKPNGPGTSSEKKTESCHSSRKTASDVSSAGARADSGGEGGRSGGTVSGVGVKRPYTGTTSSTGSPHLPATIATTNSNARLLSTTKLVTTSTDVRTEAASSSSSHTRVASVNRAPDGPEAKRPKLSGSSPFSLSPHVMPTILSSSSVATISGAVHRPDGVNGRTSTTPSFSTVSSNKTVCSGSSRTVAGSGLAKVRPSSNHAANSNKVLAPGQRVDSLLFKATNRMAAAAAATRLPSASSLPVSTAEGKTVQSERKARSESVDSRMSFINKTFGGGRSSKETCVSPAANRAAEISFSARHILSPLYYTGASRASVLPVVARKPGQPATLSTPRSTAGASSPKTAPGARDLSRKSCSTDSGKEAKSSKESCGSDGSSRGGMETMKLDIPRLSTSSRDSVFASDPESSPTPSPKYSDINRNPIKLEPGSKLCRRETWVSAENGGRRSTGSVGSPNSLGSGPGSPLETERSPARDARRPSDSDLLSQRWHGLPHHPHPHLLAIPHPRDPATVAAMAAALYNGHFKVPAAAKYLPLAAEHVPRSLSPDPMPLDFSTSSSSNSSK